MTGQSMPTFGGPPAVALYYASRDGQSQRIAEHISRSMAAAGVLAAPQDVANMRPADLVAASVIVLVAAVRYGRHLPEAERFLAQYGLLASPPPLALASVSLVARKAGKTTAAGNPYLRKAIARHRLAPALAEAFAGRLEYRRCGWLDRQIIRFIMLVTGGPTDPDTCVEFTSWPAVDEFATKVAGLHRRGQPRA
jgi:menaquinone-dependent protoporphyrinogen oxidase